MTANTYFLFCGIFCIWPFVWAVIAYFLGRYNGRIRLQSPIAIREGKPRDTLGYGSKSK